MTVRVDVRAPDLPVLLAQLRSVAYDQVPFALSVAMNRAAKDAVQDVRARLPRIYDLRSRSLAGTFGPNGRMGDTSRGWSNKRQWPDLEVTLFSEAHAMALQETGGVKPRRSREVWIRTPHVPRTRSGRVLQRYQPARIRRRLENAGRQRGQTRIFQRGATVYERERAASRAVPIYFRRERATVPPTLEFADLARATYDAKLFPRFAQSMDRARSTRR